MVAFIEDLNTVNLNLLYYLVYIYLCDIIFIIYVTRDENFLVLNKAAD